MIDAVRDWLAATAPQQPRAAGGIVLSLYRTSPKAVIVMIDDHGAATALVKVARTATAEPALVAEHDALRRIEQAGAWVRSQAPHVLGLDRVQGRLALAQSFLEGAPMTSRYYTPGHTRRRRRVAADFAAAGSWLGRLHTETASGTSPLDDEAIQRWVAGPLERYRSEIGCGAEEEALFADVLERADSLRGLALPVTAGHGDFWMGNLMAGREGLTGAVDWEHARLQTLPTDDIYKFPTSYSFYLDRALPRLGRVPGHPGWSAARDAWRRYGDWVNLAGFGYAFFGAGWYPALVRSWIEERAAAAGLDPRLHRVLFPPFLARQATALADPTFRNGYRAALAGLWTERRNTWLWHDESTRPTSSRGSSSFRRSVPASPAARSM